MRSATSGIFDLEPIALNYLNEKLSLDQTEIATLSPLRTLPERGPPLHLAVGGAELPELKRQSQEFADAGESLESKCSLVTSAPRPAAPAGEGGSLVPGCTAFGFRI